MPGHFVLPLITSELEGVSVWHIPLTQGKFAIIDTQDGPLVVDYKWHAHLSRNVWYAATQAKNSTKKHTKKLPLHKMIGKAMGITGPVDHKNGNGLDCRRKNLRPGRNKLNSANQQKLQTRTTTSKFKGVAWQKECGKWEAYIKVSGKRRHLGLFVPEDEEQAARAYDRAALKAWGSYARLNFPLN